MFSLFKRSKDTQIQSTQPQGLRTSNASVHQRMAMHSEIVRVVLTQIMKQREIPSDWLSTNGIAIVYQQGVPKCCIQMQIKHWNEKLLRYAPAIEKKILSSLDVFYPATDHSNYLVSWSFCRKIDYPITELPNKIIWSNPEPLPSIHVLATSDSVKKLTRDELEIQLLKSAMHTRDFEPTDVL